MYFSIFYKLKKRSWRLNGKIQNFCFGNTESLSCFVTSTISRYWFRLYTMQISLFYVVFTSSYRWWSHIFWSVLIHNFSEGIDGTSHIRHSSQIHYSMSFTSQRCSWWNDVEYKIWYRVYRGSGWKWLG